MERRAVSSGDGVREIWSAGGVVYRRAGDSGLEVVLVARPRERLWALPKGKPDPGESVEQTALREVSEETGLQVAIDGSEPIGSIRYTYEVPGRPGRVHKVVYHYLMQPTGGDLEQHDDEYDLVEWYDAHEACKRMTYSNERAIVERAIEALNGEEAAR